MDVFCVCAYYDDFWYDDASEYKSTKENIFHHEPGLPTISITLIKVLTNHEISEYTAHAL